MKKFIALAAGSVVLFAAANTFAASQTATMGVGATVPQRCSINAGSLNFNISAGFSVDTTSTTQISVNCQGTTTSYSIGINNGSHQTMGTGPTGDPRAQGDRNLATGSGLRIPYDVYRDATHTQRWGTTAGTSTTTGDMVSSNDSGNSFTVYAKIPAAPAAEPGAYSDRLIVTLYY